MDKETALRLIQPLTEGANVAPGWSLQAIEIHTDRIDHRKDKIHLVFSPDLTLTISYRSAQQAALKTPHFSLGIRNSEPVLSDAGRRIVSVISDRLKANDTQPPHHWVDGLASQQADTSEPVDLWLIPGHIGNPLDLSIRSLRVLRTIDLMFIEDGCQDVIAQIYAQFSLGDPPEMIAITPAITPAIDPLLTHLNAGRKSKKTMALFGANEGVPGLCDPGWRLLKACNQITPALRVQSISAGSALTTALMYAAKRPRPFVFFNLFQNEDESSALLRALARIMPWSIPPTMICFATGAGLLKRWTDLLRATHGLQGRMTLLANLSLPNERTKTLRLSPPPGEAEDFLDPSDKVVLRIDFAPQKVGLHWCMRILRALFS
jgi:16S rRNA C1402 (ribose-2'-O) methylase RsmI